MGPERRCLPSLGFFFGSCGAMSLCDAVLCVCVCVCSSCVRWWAPLLSIARRPCRRVCVRSACLSARRGTGDALRICSREFCGRASDVMSSGGRPLARGDGETPRLCEILRDEAVGVLLWPWFYDGAHRPFCDRLRLGPGKMRMPWRRGEMMARGRFSQPFGGRFPFD